MLEWKDKALKINTPKNPKKITGTRLGSILGMNPWSSPFETWCAITRVYEKPFEDSIYTLAGKAIEPKQGEYIKKMYGINLVSPTDIYGKDYFSQTRGDFFPENKIFGGMWDFLELDEKGKPKRVFEMKTGKRSEDWLQGPPLYYALQACLYARLLGIDDVTMVMTFLGAGDYDHPEDFQVKVDNTATFDLKVSEMFPDFDKTLEEVEEWHKKHVDGGISPEFDEKKDKEILDALRTKYVQSDTDIDELIKEADKLKSKIDDVQNTIANETKKYKKITSQIRDLLSAQTNEDLDKVVAYGPSYTWTVSRYLSRKIDQDKLAQDGLLEKYSTFDMTYRLTSKAN